MSLPIETIDPIIALTTDQRKSPEAKQRLGDYLVQNNMVSQNAINAALMEQEVTGDKLGIILVRNGFLTHKDLISSILHLNASRISAERVSQSRIPPDLLEEHSILLAAETDDTIYASTMDNEAVVKSIVKYYYPDKKVVFVALMPDGVSDFVDRIERTSHEFGDDSEEGVLDKLLYRALADGASDIHIIPRLASYTVFYRMLGVRRVVYEGNLEEYMTVVAQAKDRARMDLAERRVPQDGGFSIEHSGKLIDLRVATVPGADGEIIVTRVLDPDRVQPRLDKLGITRLDRWRRSFNNQHGLCLICGPTGSGKTTTLNASVREMDRFGKSIYSAEDPVEYKIPYTGQVSMNSAVGLGFARSIRSFMRADPDVIIIGEVRDEETARNAIKAADTGHMVLATLHTGSIVGSLSRLRDIGIPPHELRYLLRGVLVQSLVRIVCPACSGKGCAACGGSGYSGRTIVSECESFDDIEDVDRAIRGGKEDITWPSMMEDAIQKYNDGLTTQDELIRVFGSRVLDHLNKNGEH